MNISHLKQQGMDKLLMFALDIILSLTRILLKRAEEHYLNAGAENSDMTNPPAM